MTKHSKFYYEQVYEVVKLIPKGRVTTYGHIADFLALGSARMVGYALRNSSIYLSDLPAHRVVNASGVLTGRLHFSDPKEMARRLQKERIRVENNKVLNFKNHLWIPTDHLL